MRRVSCCGDDGSGGGGVGGVNGDIHTEHDDTKSTSVLAMTSSLARILSTPNLSWLLRFGGCGRLDLQTDNGGGGDTDEGNEGEHRSPDFGDIRTTFGLARDTTTHVASLGVIGIG